jgi:hypothetical protein
MIMGSLQSYFECSWDAQQGLMWFVWLGGAFLTIISKSSAWMETTVVFITSMLLLGIAIAGLIDNINPHKKQKKKKRFCK